MLKAHVATFYVHNLNAILKKIKTYYMELPTPTVLHPDKRSLQNK